MALESVREADRVVLTHGPNTHRLNAIPTRLASANCGRSFEARSTFMPRRGMPHATLFQKLLLIALGDPRYGPNCAAHPGPDCLDPRRTA